MEVFFSYSRKDRGLRDKLAEHLRILERRGIIRGWHDREIPPGKEWEPAIHERLNQADIILFLVSSSFLASDYCYDIEVQCAMERHEDGEAVVLPVLLRPVHAADAPFLKLNGRPSDWKPVTKWRNRDEAFADIAQGIHEAAKALQSSERARKTSTSADSGISSKTFTDLSAGIRSLPRDGVTPLENFLDEYLGSESHPVPFGGRDDALADLDA